LETIYGTWLDYIAVAV